MASPWDSHDSPKEIPFHPLTVGWYDAVPSPESKPIDTFAKRNSKPSIPNTDGINSRHQNRAQVQMTV